MAVAASGPGSRPWKTDLVDELGNVQTAIDKARQLAKLPESAPSVLIREKGKPIGVELAEQNPAALAKYLVDNIESMTGRAQYLMDFDWRVG